MTQVTFIWKYTMQKLKNFSIFIYIIFLLENMLMGYILSF